MLAQRLHVIDRLEKTGRQRTAEEIPSEVAGPRHELLVMNGEELALGDHYLDVHAVRHRTRAGVFHSRAEALEYRNRRFHHPPLVFGTGKVLLPVVAQHPDAKSLDAALEAGAVVGDRLLDAAGVSRVIAGDRLEQDRAVFDGSRHRAAMVERERIRDHPEAAHQPVSRHEPRYAAERSRAAYRASGIGAE